MIEFPLIILLRNSFIFKSGEVLYPNVNFYMVSRYITTLKLQKNNIIYFFIDILIINRLYRNGIQLITFFFWYTLLI